MSDLAPFDPERIITTLSTHGVRYVLIGALAARLQGFPRLTADADITPARDPDNLAHLAAALRDLGARIYTETVPAGLAFDWDGAALERGEIWSLVTDAGRLDLVFGAPGEADFETLAPNAIAFEVFGATLQAADLPDIVRLKEAADRPQDRQDAVVLREMLRRRESGETGEP